MSDWVSSFGFSLLGSADSVLFSSGLWLSLEAAGFPSWGGGVGNNSSKRLGRKRSRRLEVSTHIFSLLGSSAGGGARYPLSAMTRRMFLTLSGIASSCEIISNVYQKYGVAKVERLVPGYPLGHYSSFDQEYPES